MLVQHLRRHFYNANEIEHPNLREYLWRAEIDRRKILIDSLTKWSPQETSARPAVLIRRNSWQVNQRGIGNVLQGQTGIDGWQRYNVLMSGSHTLFCLAREPGECETLAAEVFLELLGFSQELRENLDLLRFIVVEVGQMMIVEESRQHFGIPVTVAYAHNQTWTVRKHVPVLGKIELSTFRP